MNTQTITLTNLIEQTKTALEQNGFTVFVAENGQEAKKKALELIPEGAEVMTMTSVTNQTIGLTEALDNSVRYHSVRNKLNALDKSQVRQKKTLGAAPEYATGSVHAITQDGVVLIASNTGSQLAGYVYGSDKVIWVVGMQKIVPNLEAGIKRIYDYVLPKESVRLNAQYNIDTGSFVSKLLIVNRETVKDRINIILVKENLGF